MTSKQSLSNMDHDSDDFEDDSFSNVMSILFNPLKLIRFFRHVLNVLSQFHDLLRDRPHD
jgi:hypothetical protein